VPAFHSVPRLAAAGGAHLRKEGGWAHGCRAGRRRRDPEAGEEEEEEERKAKAHGAIMRSRGGRGKRRWKRAALSATKNISERPTVFRPPGD
jgi:hypothetical protein